VTRVLFIFAFAPALTRADSLNDVLQRIDQSAVKFRSMSANFKLTEYTDLFQETTVQEGTFKMLKSGKDKYALLADFTGRDPHTFHASGHQAEMYYPKANTEEIYDTRKFAKAIDQYLFVGFGTSAAELKKTYNVTLGGPETVDGLKTTRIDLTPISQEAKTLFDQIQLWIPDGKGNPIQEKMISGKAGKDYKLFKYDNLKIISISDPAPSPADFELKVPAGVRRVGK